MTNSKPTPKAAAPTRPARTSNPKSTISKRKPAPPPRPKAPLDKPVPYPSEYKFVSWWDPEGRGGQWRARIRDRSGTELFRGLFKPADDTAEAHAAAAELAARAAAVYLHAHERGEEASFDAAGLPQTPRFTGVSEDKKTGKFRATIEEGGTSVNLGSYTTKKKAALAYDARAWPLGRRTNLKKFRK